MSLRSRTAGAPAKTRRRKTVKRRNAAKAPVRRNSSAVSRETKVALIARERDEALEQLAAASEVLKVISSSPGDLQPVFEAMLENATRICEAKFGTLYLAEDDLFRVAAQHNAPPELGDFQRRRGSFQPLPGSLFDDVMRRKQVGHVADITAEAVTTAATRLSGARSTVYVPMLKDDELIGVFAIYRQEVRPFSDKQIALVQNFAAQAVIAIENTRLLNELRQRTDDLTELLEQQTATSEVLKVISSSPGDLQPVFETMLENAIRICEAKFAHMFRYRDGTFRTVATYNTPPAFKEFLNRGPVPASPETILGQIVCDPRTVQVEDITKLEIYANRHPFAVAGVELGGIRTLLTVPMIKDGALIGTISIFRQQVRPFTDKQIELVTNFAAQAVIAIENTRLLNELRQRTNDLTESLEQQTATAEVLQVISSSPGTLAPVFEAMLEKAMQLCEAAFGGVWKLEGDRYVAVALRGVPDRYAAFLAETTIVPGPGTAPYRLLHGEPLVHNVDLAAEEPYRVGDPQRRALVDIGGARTALQVLLRKEDAVLGVITIYRQEVRPFTDKQIELFQSFAAQAVIAIENTRLLNELRQRTDDLTEALEQQTATADVLRVISSSPGDLEPVFQAMLENATRICEAKFGVLFRFDGELYEFAAEVGTPPELAEFVRRRGPFMPAPDTQLYRILRTGRVSHTADYAAEAPNAPPVTLGGARSTVDVPMFKDGALAGAISVYRREVRPFTDKQIELLQNFAAQAVIAIENTRLLNELRQSLEQQTATADVLSVISKSPGDLQPVFEAMLVSATRICEANFGGMFRLENGAVRMVTQLRVPERLSEFLQKHRDSFGPLHPWSRLIQSRRTLHIVDYSNDRAYLERDPVAIAGVELGGIRTLLAVPMLKDDELVGFVTIFRQEVRPFTDK